MLKDDQRLGCNQNMGFNRPMAGGLHHPNAANTEKRWPDFSIEKMMANHETIITGWWFGTFGLFSIYWE